MSAIGDIIHTIYSISAHKTHIRNEIFSQYLLRSIYLVNLFRFHPDGLLLSVILLASASEGVDPSDPPENELYDVI